MTTNENHTAPAANLIVGNGTAVHAPGRYIETDPRCGGVRINGRAQARRRTAKPVTCQKCLAKD